MDGRRVQELHSKSGLRHSGKYPDPEGSLGHGSIYFTHVRDSLPVTLSKGNIETPKALQEVQVSDPHLDDVVQNLPPSENRRFYPALDGLRAVAVLMVFCQHYFARPTWLRWGWTGVDVFFVLSGFLITGILYDTRNTQHRFKNFYVRRTLRIFPLYYAILLAAILLMPILHWVYHPIWYLWPLYLENYGRFIWVHDLQTNPYALDHLLSATRHFANPPLVFYLGHFWSLCVEEQFYLAWPLVVFLVKDRVRLRNVCAAAFFVVLAARVLCVLAVPRNLLEAGLLERFTPLRVDALLVGGFVALCLRGPEAARLTRFARPIMWAVAGAFLAMEGYYVVSTGSPYNPGVWVPWLGTIGYSMIDLFAAGLILQAIQPETGVYRILEYRWLRRLGQISYGFYVFHDIPHILYIKLVRHLFGANATHFSLRVAALALVGTLLMAYSSFRFFEAPFLKLKDRFTA